MYFQQYARQIYLDDVMVLTDMDYEYLYYLQSYDTYFRMVLDCSDDGGGDRNSYRM